MTGARDHAALNAVEGLDALIAMLEAYPPDTQLSARHLSALVRPVRDQVHLALPDMAAELR